MRTEAAVVSSGIESAESKMLYLFTNGSHVHDWQRIYKQFTVTRQVKYKVCMKSCLVNRLYKYLAVERLRARNV